MDCSTPGFPVLHCLPEFAQIHVHWVQMLSNHLNLCHPLLLLPSIFSSIRVFSSESALRIRWPKYWSFSISPSNEHSGLISFRIDWFDLLAVRGTLKSLLQHHSSKASILQCSVQFNCSVMSDSLQPHGLQHARPPCPLPTPGVYSNSCLLSRWCHATISSCYPLLFLPQSFTVWGSFQWVGPLHQVAKVLEFQLQHHSFQQIFRTVFLLGWTAFISLLSKGVSRVFSNTTVQKH